MGTILNMETGLQMTKRVKCSGNGGKNEKEILY